ncbi:ParB/RepB/Spo0J family partition protein [Bdellovibrionota bacterium FG-1]
MPTVSTSQFILREIDIPSSVDLQIDPLAVRYPFSEERVKALADDIRKNGLIQPVVVREGKVIAGRHRLKACLLAGVPPRFLELVGDCSVEAWVLGDNSVRRHESASQRACGAVSWLPYFENEARNRREAGKPVLGTLGGAAALKAGNVFGVGQRYVEAAKQLHDADQEAFLKVFSGELTLSAAGARLKKRKGCTKLAGDWKSASFEYIDREPAEFLKTGEQKFDLLIARLSTELLAKYPLADWVGHLAQVAPTGHAILVMDFSVACQVRFELDRLGMLAGVQFLISFNPVIDQSNGVVRAEKPGDKIFYRRDHVENFFVLCHIRLSKDSKFLRFTKTSELGAVIDLGHGAGSVSMRLASVWIERTCASTVLDLFPDSEASFARSAAVLGRKGYALGREPEASLMDRTRTLAG